MESTEPLVRMAIHMMVKCHKFKLSKENKMKAEKHRIQVLNTNCDYFLFSNLHKILTSTRCTSLKLLIKWVNTLTEGIHNDGELTPVLPSFVRDMGHLLHIKIN